MKYQYHYLWKPINEIGMKKLCKETGLSMHCKFCDEVMIDRLGRKRTKESIWEYGIGQDVFGHTHEGCAYGVEVPNSDKRDENFGKHPRQWDLKTI